MFQQSLERKDNAPTMKIPFNILGKTIKYTDKKGEEREGFVVEVYDAVDSSDGEGGMLFSGERENLIVSESEVVAIEVIE